MNCAASRDSGSGTDCGGIIAPVELDEAEDAKHPHHAHDTEQLRGLVEPQQLLALPTLAAAPAAVVSPHLPRCEAHDQKHREAGEEVEKEPSGEDIPSGDECRVHDERALLHESGAELHEDVKQEAHVHKVRWYIPRQPSIAEHRFKLLTRITWAVEKG